MKIETLDASYNRFYYFILFRIYFGENYMNPEIGFERG